MMKKHPDIQSVLLLQQLNLDQPFPVGVSTNHIHKFLSKMTWFCSIMPGVQYSTILWVLLGLSMIWTNCHQCQRISCPKTHCQLTGIKTTQYTSQILFLFNHYNFEAVVVVLSNRQHLAKLPCVEPATWLYASLVKVNSVQEACTKCSAVHIKIWNLANHMKIQNKNIKNCWKTEY